MFKGLGTPYFFLFWNSNFIELNVCAVIFFERSEDEQNEVLRRVLDGKELKIVPY